MSIKEFDIEVVTTKNVTVKIDTNTITEAFLEEFSEYMWDVDSVEDIAKHIAYCTAMDIDPEGVGSLKQYNETEDQALEKNGFVSYYYSKDTETSII